jgi:hypothetical protein
MRFDVLTELLARPGSNEQIRTLQETLVSCARKPFGHRKRFQGTGGGFLKCGHFQSVFIPFPKLRGNYRVFHRKRRDNGPLLHDSCQDSRESNREREKCIVLLALLISCSAATVAILSPVQLIL